MLIASSRPKYERAYRNPVLRVGSSTSSRPHKTGRSDPGSQIHTNARSLSSASELIVIRRSGGSASRGKQAETITALSELAFQADAVDAEQWHATQDGEIERDADADGWIAPFDPDDRSRGHPGTLRELTDRPAALDAPLTDLGAEQLTSVPHRPRI